MLTDETDLIVDNAYYVVENMERARAFYETLGFTVQFADGEKWLQLRATVGRLALSNRAEAPVHNGGGVMIVKTNDINAVRNKVVTANGEILHERDMGAHGRTMLVSDGQGNLMQFLQK